MAWLNRLLTRHTDVGVLVLRMWLGFSLAFAHGLGKVSDPSHFLSGGGMSHFPFPVAMGWFAMLSEFAGGILLGLGLFTRLAALSILGTMLGAGIIVHADDGFSVKEKALTIAAVALFFVFYGGGKYAVERLWRRSATADSRA